MDKIRTAAFDIPRWMKRYDDGLPDFDIFTESRKDLPPVPEELIGGILRKGHKMLISGSSKAGKSFLLMELCTAIADGRDWLGFPCRKGKVLYVNLEIDPASCFRRFESIYEALGQEPSESEELVIWNLRGSAMPMDRLVPALTGRLQGKGFAAVVIDPIYKVLMGDENSAAETGAFCNQLDRICCETGAAVIYSHHHSKGLQGSKKAMDRASGSGVFARDPDALLDLIQLELTPLQRYLRGDCATAWRMESSLREFADIKPRDIWFSCPLHEVDDSGLLDGAEVRGSPAANLLKSPKRTSEAGRRDSLEKAFEAVDTGGPVKVSDLADYMGKTQKTVRRYIDEFADGFRCENGTVLRTS